MTDKTVLREIACPVCEGMAYNFIGNPKVSASARVILGDRADLVRVVKCRACGLSYANPMPFWGESDIEALYDETYFAPMSKWWARRKSIENPRRRLDVVQDFLNENERVTFLEVGCGAGYAMTEAARRGWHVQGQDVSYAVSKLAREHQWG